MPTGKNEELPTDTTPIELEEDIHEVAEKGLYYCMKNICGKYYEYINQYNTDTYYSRLEGEITVTPEEKQDTYETICKLLDSKYIKDNSIDDNYIKKMLITYKESDDFEINKMYSQDIDENTTIMWADISLLKEYKKTNNNKVVIAKLDRKNSLFSIIPKEITSQQILQDKVNVSTDEIEENTYNKYKYQIISDEQIVSDLLMKYKYAVLYNREDAYALLDKEYREKRFGDYNTFSKYIDNNIKEINALSFSKYLVNNYNEYKEYICADAEGNLYIFHDKSIMDFSVILDTYTVVLPQFTEKYDSVNNTKKVAMNIDKIVQALNVKDGKYIYSKLDDVFKKNNFPTLNDFQNYINEKYPSTYDFECSTYNEENGVHVQDIILKDKKNQEQIESSIIMKLKDNYDFVMSFTIK